MEFDLIGEINRRTNTPMALHGGTGLSDEIIQKCIKLGCAKINISTNLKHVFIDSFVDYHNEDQEYEPLNVLGAQYSAQAAVQGQDRSSAARTAPRAALEGRLSAPIALDEGADLRLRRCARRHRA